MKKFKIEINELTEKMTIVSCKNYGAQATVYFYEGSYEVSAKGWSERFEYPTKKEAIARAKKMVQSDCEDKMYQ